MSRTTVKIIITPTTMAATIAPEPGGENSLTYKVVFGLFDKFKVLLTNKQTPPHYFSYFDRDSVLETLWSR